MSNDAQPTVNPFAAHQQMLGERLSILLASLHPVLSRDVVRALEAEGKLLSPSHPEAKFLDAALPAGMWPLLTLLIAQYVSPNIDAVSASSVAVAVECLVCAIDLLDDIIDGDQTSTVQALGEARVLNVSTSLLTLAQQAILSLSQQGIDPLLILRLFDTLQESTQATIAGQHRDVLAEQRSVRDFSLEECIEIAAAKASLMRLACRLGALCAGADDVLCEQFSELGTLLGIAHQLDNDCHDLYYMVEGKGVAGVSGGTAADTTKTDLARGKKTLPIVLAAKSDDTLQGATLLADEKSEAYLRALHEGIITTWGISLLYRERARDRLQEIEAQRPIDPVLRLLLGL